MTELQSGHRSPARIVVALAAILFWFLPGNARAYTISNELLFGCHEALTGAALRNVRKDLQTATPLVISDDDRALVDDLQFIPDADMRDLGGATLLVAVRDNDLKGRPSDDLSALAEVHGDPDAQHEHCLRAPDHKEPGGSQAAVDACRAFIRERAQTAIGGLDDKGTPDPNKRTALTVHLSIRGKVSAPLPTYYVAAGEAIHAIEDSFTHTYRTADEMKITVALNYFAQVNGTLDESRDGPGHAKELDRCDDPDDLRKTRRLLAIEAATAFLRATLDPQKTNDQKMAAVDALLDKYISYSPGCTFDNNWCNAPENQYKDTKGCGCGLGSVDEGLGAMLAGGALLVLAVARRARRRRSVVAALGVVSALSLASAEARADPPPTKTTTNTPAHPATSTSPATPETSTTTTSTPSGTPGTAPTTATVVTTPETTTTTITAPTPEVGNAPPPPTVVAVSQPGPVDESRMAFGGYAGLSGSVEKPALAGTVGARLRMSRQWTLGLDGEWNPWIAFNGTTVREGAVNVYGTAMLRFPLAYENFNLRVSASAGGSYLLSDLYGAPSGSIGLYVGASPLSVEWKLSRSFYLIINPINFALPIPRLTGVPLLYPQYRTSIGFEVYSG